MTHSFPTRRSSDLVKGASFNAKLPDGGPPLAPSEFPYAPETLYSFEAGTKTSLMDGLVRLSAAAFYNDYKDYQTFTLTNASGIISNNDAHAWGVETNAKFTFSSAFQGSQIGRAHVCTPVTNAQLVCRLLL